MKKRVSVPLLTIVTLILGLLVTSNISGEERKDNKKDSQILTLSAQNYNAETAKGLVLVDFWAVWCGPCRKMNPVLEDISKEMKDVVKIGKLNIDNYKKLAIDKQVQSIPTIIVYKDGKEIDRITGVVAKEDLKKAIKIYSTANLAN